jgi:hypothetical protein
MPIEKFPKTSQNNSLFVLKYDGCNAGSRPSQALSEREFRGEGLAATRTR